MRLIDKRVDSHNSALHLGSNYREEIGSSYLLVLKAASSCHLPFFVLTRLLLLSNSQVKKVRMHTICTKRVFQTRFLKFYVISRV